jgi:UDP:flavonoid glycosyltransferase YjiC (YdhE family)
MRALSHGVPVLVLPMHPMLDQPMVGAAASRNGVGRSLSRKASPETIGAAITAMLGDPALTAAARRMGEDIRRADGAVVAADLVEQFAAGRRAGGEEPVSPR